MNHLLSSAALLAVLVLASCRSDPATGPRVSAPPAETNGLQTFQVKGVIVDVRPAMKAVSIRHEAIPGYMPAMTMPFKVKDTRELAGLAAGDRVSFRMLVTAEEGWIDQVHKLAFVPSTNAPTATPVGLHPASKLLQSGDLLPEYHFTNQLGQAVDTAQFRGQALAINFLFTRCPFPEFCPWTANNFSAVQRKLLALPQGPTNWHLLTISMDPEFDKPEVLKKYGEEYKNDPRRWSFAMGDMAQTTALGGHFGLTFRRDATGSISHNQRAAVIDSSGRLQKVFEGNQWTSDGMVTEMVKAAAK